MNSCYPISLCATIFAALVLVGCTGEMETDPSSVSTSSNGSTPINQVESDEQQVSIVNSIPDNFPGDIHLVDGAKSTDFTQSGDKGNLILEYPEVDSDEFVKSYLDGMSKQGWAQVSSSKLPIGTITNFTKDGRKCTISISPPNDELVKVAIIY